MTPQSLFLIIIMLALLGWLIYGGIYNTRDHVRCADKDKLKPDAQIKDIQRKQVGTARKGTAKYRTTVIFDDGFEYISHITNRQQTGLFQYSISAGKEENMMILHKAMEAHTKALETKQK